MDIVTESAVMKKVDDLVSRVAVTDANVLVLGESGTGKDLVAWLIHDRSLRKNAPLVTIDCASLPESLLESELFGYEKGAFTGASDAKPGRFEAAEGGTIVLNEIASLASASQAKLLRVIEDRSFERLGGKQQIKIDVRLIALANVDLKEAVRAHTFRDDLYYRLNVVTIDLPKLAERLDDIETLAEQFARHFGARAGRPGVSVGAEAIAMLRDYDFPGNVRELRNIIERSVMACDDDTITPDDLPEYLRSAARIMHSQKHKPTLAEVEAVYISEVLEFTRGNKTRAAEILGISRKNLYEKMRRYNIGVLKGEPQLDELGKSA